MYHNYCNGTGSFTLTSASDLCDPTGVAVDSNGDLYIADFENSRVVEYNAPYAAYAAIPQTCTATNPCENKLSANLVFGQVDGSGNPVFTTTSCNGTHGEGAVTSNEELCSPEGVSVDPTTHDLYVADSFNNRVVVYLDPLAGGGMQGTSGHPGDTTADYVFGQGGSFTTTGCNANGSPSGSRPISARCRISARVAAAESVSMLTGMYISPTPATTVCCNSTRAVYRRRDPRQHVVFG